MWVCIEYARFNNAQEFIQRWVIYWDNNIPAPSKQTVIKTFRKCEQEDSCHNLNKGRRGRTAENIELVRQSLTENGQRSSWKNGLGLSCRTFQRIVRLDLNFHPYILIQR